VLTVIEADQQLWRSPSGWWIDDFALVDVTNDGQTDISLSVWKEGDYGPSKPFWVKENNQDVRNHFFIFDLIDNQVQPVWQSSNLSVPNCTFHIADTNQDGKNELLVTEGDYKNWPACIGLYSAGWQWNGWGFTNEWRRVKPRAD
jgi:poly-gamma-glutamate synthesis protein (capsule biosynthesis protein)